MGATELVGVVDDNVREGVFDTGDTTGAVVTGAITEGFVETFGEVTMGSLERFTVGSIDSTTEGYVAVSAVAITGVPPFPLPRTPLWSLSVGGLAPASSDPVLGVETAGIPIIAARSLNAEFETLFIW